MTTDDGISIESQMQRLAHNGIALASGGIVAQLAFTLLEILIARKLGAQAYGVFVTAYAWTVLGACLMEFGTPLWTIQEGSRRQDRLPSLLGSGLTVNLVMFAILYLLLAVVTNTIAPNAVLNLMLIILPYGLILAVQQELAAVYSSYQRMQVSAFFQGIAPIAVLVVYFIYSANDLALADVGFAYVVGGGIVTGIWFVRTMRRIRPRFSTRHIRSTLFSSYQYGLTGILGQIYVRSDIVLLSALAGLREAGIYAAAFKLVDLVSKVSVLAGRVFAPAIFKASHESDKAFKMLASMMTRALVLAGLLAGIVSFVLADELIRLLFGNGYAASVPILRTLGGVMAAKCMMAALQLLLSSLDLHLQRVVGLSVTVIVHIAASVVLIPTFGAQGAAGASMLSGVLAVLLYAYSSTRRHPFQFRRWLLVPSCLAALIALATLATDLDVYLQAILSVTAFLAGLYAIRFIKWDEIEFVVRSVLTRSRS